MAKLVTLGGRVKTLLDFCLIDKVLKWWHSKHLRIENGNDSTWKVNFLQITFQDDLNS